jgi:IPT/TIG domain/Beta-propeller repeat
MLRSLKSVFSLAAVAMFAAAVTAAAKPAAESYGRLPLLFEQNEGQVDPAVRFLSRGRGYSLYLTASEAALRLNDGPETATVRWQVVGANPDACISGERPQATKSSYFIGNDRSKWRTGVANYGQVRYEGVYPGVDLVYHGNQRQVEYDFVVAPHADPRQIRLAFDGIESMHLGKEGELVLRTAHGDLLKQRPVVYQERNGKREPVQGSYALLDDNEVTFHLGPYDRSKALVIDPVIVYSTYFGGTNYDETDVIAADSDGNAYVAGLTISPSFPGSGGIVIQPQSGGDYDVFVAKINPQGTAVVWATYLGGTEGVEYSEGIAVDGAGNVYVSGDSNSTDFPVTAGALQTTHSGGNRDSWVAKINSAGTALAYCTYLGGSGDEGNLDLAIDGSGNAYVVGYTGSPAFPGMTGSSIQPALSGGSDGYLVKLNPTGTAAVYATYLGGSSGWDSTYAVFVDASGNAYVGGSTASTAFPGVSGSSLQPAHGGSSRDAYLTKINAAGSAILFSTFLGGTGFDNIHSVVLDSSGDILVTGLTTSTNFPGVTGGSIQPAYSGGYDAHITKLNSNATAILWATYLGGTNDEFLVHLELDAADNLYVADGTYSTNFPGVSGSSIQPAHAGGDGDGFVAKINAAGSAIDWATYLGAGTWESVYDFDVDAAGTVYAVGLAESTFPGVTGDAIQPVNAGGTDYAGDGFIIKITGLGPALASINPTSGYPGTQVTLTGTNFGALQGSGSVWLGSKLAGSIVSWTNTQIVAVVAAGAASGSAIVQQNGIWSNSIAFTVIAPNVTSISPTSGFPGTQVTFTGTNFGATQGSGSVWLGSKAAGSIVSWSNTQVVATVAANAASGNAQIQQNGVWSNAIAFTVPTPNVTSITPTSGAAGTQVTFTGTNFGATQGSGSVWLGSKLAGSIVSWSNTQIVATIASGSKSGSAQVQQGSVWSNSIAFTVITPNVTGISPASGPAGTQVTITGTGFGTTQGSGLVWLGTKYAAVVSWSDTQVVATVAAGSATGGTQVYQNGVWSNAVTFTVTP